MEAIYEKIKQYVKDHGNEGKTVSAWQEITGNFGTKNYHDVIAQKLLKKGLLINDVSVKPNEYSLNHNKVN